MFNANVDFGFYTLLVYASLYSIALACGLSLMFSVGWLEHRHAAVFFLSLFVFALGFPPSPLFVLKLSLGASYATNLGLISGFCLGLLLMVIWVRFAKLLLLSFTANKDARLVGLPRSVYGPILIVFVFTLLVCLPVGLIVISVV